MSPRNWRDELTNKTMKSTQVSLYTFGILAVSMLISSNLFGQTASKYRSDATYSTHNYKHPNKASAARQWNPEASLTLRASNTQQLGLGDYKRFANRDTTSLTVAVPTVGVPASINYKTKQSSLAPYRSTRVDSPAEPKPAPSVPGVRPVTGGERPIQQ